MRREALLLLGTTGLAVAFVAVSSAPRMLPPSTSCAHAIVVHGELRCGDEAAQAVRAACGDAVEAIAGDVIDGPSCTARSRMNADDLELLAVPVDVNSASVDDLESLRGVGPVVAARIVEQRPYAKLEDLDRVKGIGPATLRAMRPRVALHPPQIR